MGRRPHGAVYALLAVSLAVNLIGVGYFLAAGFADHRAAGRQKQPRTVERTIDFVAGRYPQPVAAAVKSKLEARRDEVAAALQEMRAARRATREAMTEEPLDRARVEAAFEVSLEKSKAFQLVIQRAVLDALPDLPPAERSAIEKDDDPE